ncbi:MAG: AAA family ATPase [Gammaproteobacteria bacterium]|nr:AAA family ATPase [Gammaproteobacteria bacterium]
MYHEHFGLQEDPFSITPDPKYTYLSERHREALAHLVYGVTEGGGFVQLTGEVGTGKTTLCRNLLMLLPDELNIALIFNPRQTPLELVASLCDELHIDYPPGCSSLKLLVDRLNAYLLESHAAGRRTVLIVDEAQNLNFDALEQVRLLTNLETATQKLLQIILVGQPELKSLLEQPELRQLAQRITARYHLTPLDADETRAYVQHRLEVAGHGRRLFTPGALRLLPKMTGGVPRVINVLCGRAMLAAYGKRRELIDARLMRQVAKELQGSAARPGRLRWAWAWGLAGLLGVALGLGAWQQLDPESLPGPLREWPVLEALIASPPAAQPAARMAPPPQEPIASETSAVAVNQAASPTSTTQAVVPLRPSSVDKSTEKPAVEPADEPLTPLVQAPAPELSSAVPPVLQEDITPVSAGEPLAPVAQVIDNALSLVGLLDDIANAFTTLFSYWQEDFPLRADGSACEKAARVGLQCLYGRGHWDNLRFYNRPAVIELLLDSGRRYHVVVTALQGKQVTLDLGRQRVQVPTGELDPLWSGSYIVLWRPPVLRSEYLQQGSRGADVHWLSEMLARVDGLPSGQPADPALAEFDWQLTKRVMAFQRATGLVQDGIVGKQTLIKLMAAIGDPAIPALDRG